MSSLNIQSSYSYVQVSIPPDDRRYVHIWFSRQTIYHDYHPDSGIVYFV